MEPTTASTVQNQSSKDKDNGITRYIKEIEKKLKDRILVEAANPADDSVLQLGKFKDPRAISILAKIVKDYTDDLTPGAECAAKYPESFKPSSVRISALKAFKEIGDKSAVPYVKKALDDPNFSVKWMAANILLNTWDIKDEVAPLFIKIATVKDLDELDPFLKQGTDNVYYDLVEKNSKNEALISQLIDIKERRILSALKALSQISTPAALSALKKARSSGATPRIKDKAGRLLQRMGKK